LWRLVVEALQRDIAGRKYKPGDRLPTEAELARDFNVHRNTVRRAIGVLRDREYVRVEQGRGTFVKERLVRHHLGPKTRLTAALRDIDRVGERRFIGTARVRAGKQLARDLNIPESRFLRRVDTLTLVDGAAVSVASSYFPLPRFEQIEQLIQQTGGFTESLKRFGVLEYRRHETRISAVQLSSADAKLLQLARRQPAIFITNINVDADGVPIVVSFTRISPQHMELVVRFEA
jgi:GntR family phosphonate transport system transcriptional regulator